MSADLEDEDAAARAGFEDDVVGFDVSEQHGNSRHLDRRRELLPFDLILAAYRLCGQSIGQLDGPPHVDAGQEVLEC